MGNRMIRETLLESETLSALSDFDFRLWIVLILLADDYGVVDARPAIIKGRGYALRDRVSVKAVDDGLLRLATAGCISLYDVDGKSYAQFPKWGNHQRLRDSKHKYPTLEQAAANGGELRQVAASCGKLRPEVELELEVELEQEGEGKRARARFTPPTLEDVKSYADEKGWALSVFNPERFVDYYASKGWKVGKSQSPMVDWKAAARGWVSRENDNNGSSKEWKNPALDYEQREYKEDQFSDLFIDLEHYGKTGEIKTIREVKNQGG